MEIYIFLLIWICVYTPLGIWCAVNSWRKNLPVLWGQIPFFIIIGMTVGPIIGLIDLLCFVGRKIFSSELAKKELLGKK